jgi:spermidine synthase
MARRLGGNARAAPIGVGQEELAGADDRAGTGASPGVDRAPSSGGSARGFDAWVPLLFMASGAAGLIYQVVWTRDLVLVFGNTTQAIVTTVTAFLAGLGIGSLLGGTIGPRLRRALTVYGLLEVAVGCLALLMPLAFDAIATLFRSAYLSLPPGEVALIRFGLAFCALTPVTLLMGMSLPVLTRHLVRTDPDVGERIARLYGLNTLGAVVGTVASGFVLIELLGLVQTTFVAVALNLSAGIGALLISRTVPRSRGELPAASESRPRLDRRQMLLLAVTFVSGFVSLALEVLWTRVLVQGTGSSIYVFVAVVAVYLIGIAGGSLAYERLQHRTPPVAALGACLAGAGGLTLVPVIVSNIQGPPGLPLVVALILPVTVLLGYAFPLTVRLFVGSAASASRGIGLVYAANTAGCVVGTVTAGFILIPTLGTNVSVITLCIFEAAIGSALAVAFAPRWRPLRAGIGVCLTGVLVFMLFVPAARLTNIQRYTHRVAALTGRPVAHFEDEVASIDVIGGPARARKLLVNGIGITALTIDTKLLAYIPKALRPNATSILDICFGMGSTYRSSIILGMHTDAVELDPTIPSLMSWFYPDASTYLHSPLGHIIINDGRNYVRLTNNRYDIITIDSPPPLWSAGTVVLMTQQFYQEAAQRLEPGGILASFIPYSEATQQRMFLRTFRASFRYMMVIRGPRPFGMYLLGSDAPMTLRANTIDQVFGSPAAQADLAGAPDYPRVPVGSWPSIIDKLVWMTNGQVNAYTGTGPLLTDDHPLSEYFLISAYNTTSVPYEPTAVNLVLVVMGLLGLLIIGIALAALPGPRRRPAHRQPGGSRVGA